jgi:hypothetical protein
VSPLLQIGTFLGFDGGEEDHAWIALGEKGAEADYPFHRGNMVRLHRTRYFGFKADPTACPSTTGARDTTKQTFYAAVQGLRGGQRNDVECYMGWSRENPGLGMWETQYEYGSLVTLRGIDSSSQFVVMAVVVNRLADNGPTALLCRKDDLEKCATDLPVRSLVSTSKFVFRQVLTSGNKC